MNVNERYERNLNWAAAVAIVLILVFLLTGWPLR